MNQTEIIYNLKKGDAAQFSEVVSTWQRKVYNTALSIVNNEEDAEDITQEVFVALFEEIDNFRGESTLSTWIYRVTVRKSLDHEKRKKRIKHGGLIKRIFLNNNVAEPVNFEHPGIQLDNKERAVVLFNALRKLPDKQRIAFTLHKIEGLSSQDIAAVMKTTLFAIESLQTRAKNNLRKILKEYYGQND